MARTSRNPGDRASPPWVDPEVLRTMEPVRTIPGRNRTKADLSVYRREGETVAVKDYGPRPFWIRQTLGRWLVRRETAAYRAAAGIAGLPAFLGRVGPFALATRWVEARSLRELAGSEVDPRCFDRALEIVEALHRRGIALGDLHHRDVLVTPEGAVYLVDLTTAWVLGRRAGRLSRWIFRRFRDQDRVALARLRARFRGEDTEAAVEAVGRTAAAWHRRGRFLSRLRDRVLGRSP